MAGLRSELKVVVNDTAQRCQGRPQQLWNRFATNPRSINSTNLAQFFEGTSMFTEKRAVLYAQTAELHAIYSIELKTSDGKHIRMFTGTTTNGIIDLQWDLRDDQGNKYTGRSFDSIYNVTLPDSGRSQTIQ